MPTRLRTRWIRLSAASAGVAISFALPATAAAVDHLIKLREVFAGSPTASGAQFIEAQFMNANQNLVAGNMFHVYGPTGTLIDTYTFAANVSGTATQSSLLVATPQATTFFGLDADLSMSPAIPRGGGKVCYEDVDNATAGIIDCVSWGSYSGDPDPDPGSGDNTGNPFAPSTGIPFGHSAERDISAGNPSLLEAADDTGDSAADFLDRSNPVARNNAGETTSTASTATIVGGVATLEAAAGVHNNVAVIRHTSASLRFRDAAAPINAGAGCTQLLVNEVRCSAVGISASIDAGDGNDQVGTDVGAIAPTDTTVDGGPGADRITTTNGDDILIGGSQVDTLSSGTGDDSLIGGSENDTLSPGTGTDTVDGGPGADTASYSTRTYSKP